jgi:hypothetical protein
MAYPLEGQRPATKDELDGTKNLKDHAMHLGADDSADRYFEQMGVEVNTGRERDLPLELKNITDIHGKPSRSANNIKMPLGMQEN